MNKRNEILASAALTFEERGFRGIGIDHVLATTGVSTRTFYKHFGSRDGLVIAVLEARHLAFVEQLASEGTRSEPIGSLFDTLREWTQLRGAHGCMLLRARSEYAGANAEIVALVERQKTEFRAAIAARVLAALGRENDELRDQIWLVFEGATAAASVSNVSVIGEARSAALTLVECARARQR
jgi:AcrR family transcriptional regulator